MPKPETATETAPEPVKVPYRKPDTVARCICGAWVMYREPNEKVRCGKCRVEFVPAKAKRAHVGDPSA
jgi:hypothetical protein